VSSKRKRMQSWMGYPCKPTETAELGAKGAAEESNRGEARKKGYEAPLGEVSLSEKRAS
jgi:hypothetical protein